jgi:hypothetical protein
MTARPEPIVLHTADGILLEAEVARAPEARAGAVLCHPHPRFGGTMRSIVISALFGALPAAGVTCVRFNFRGVERSGGTWGEGHTEPTDVVAALDAVVTELPHAPVFAVGWSFGADMALKVGDTRLAGWVAIAAPLRFGPEFAAAGDPRPAHFLLAEHDEVRDPASVQSELAHWRNATAEIVPGASHFFVGRTDQVVDATLRFVLPPARRIAPSKRL